MCGLRIPLSCSPGISSETWPEHPCFLDHLSLTCPHFLVAVTIPITPIPGWLLFLWLLFLFWFPDVLRSKTHTSLTPPVSHFCISFFNLPTSSPPDVSYSLLPPQWPIYVSSLNSTQNLSNEPLSNHILFLSKILLNEFSRPGLYWKTLPWVPHVNSEWVKVALCNPMDCSPSGSAPSLGFSREEYWSGLPFPSSL